jgi:hypothetical protein
MNKRKWWLIAVVVLFLAAITFYGYQHWGSCANVARADVLALMPADANAVLYIDLSELRASAFLAQLYAWAPRPQIDADYAQFLHDTEFDYERDLDRVAIGILKQSTDSTLIAVAQGRFDHKKIAAQAAQSGTRMMQNGREIFCVPVNGSQRRIFFTFLRDDRIALTDDAAFARLFAGPGKDASSGEWRERFRRLAGSPVFAVIRQDAGAGDALARQAPGGLRSPQLSTLLDQLQWITIAGKPEGKDLRVVAEGECTSDRTVRQLADLLNGVMVLAESGLNDANARKQLGPQTREAYLQLLKSADVSRIDRGDTKSVRVVFDLTPKFLEAAQMTRAVVPEASAGVPKEPASGKGSTRK